MSYCKVENGKVVGLDWEEINKKQQEIDNLVKPKFTLREKRKEKHMTITQLSEISGVHLQTIRALEKGINDPREAKISTLIKLAKALKCKVRNFYPCEKNI